MRRDIIDVPKCGRDLLDLIGGHLHAARGTNVSVAVFKDDGVFIDSCEPTPGLRCTGLLQTYLDLSRAGDRGREAADHLRKTRLEPKWSTLL